MCNPNILWLWLCLLYNWISTFNIKYISIVVNYFSVQNKIEKPRKKGF